MRDCLIKSVKDLHFFLGLFLLIYRIRIELKDKNYFIVNRKMIHRLIDADEYKVESAERLELMEKINNKRIPE